MTHDEYEDWVSVERGRVKAYLEREGISEPNVEWPAFDVPPYFAIWAVESKRAPGKVGWWAFSGDFPTDYVSENGNCHPRSALRLLLDQWSSYLPALKAGTQPDGVNLGCGSSRPEMLGDLLEKRVAVLKRWVDDDDLWKDL